MSDIEQELKNGLEYLNNTKTLIRSAIVNKGQAITDGDSFRSYANKIGNIKTGIIDDEEYFNCLNIANQIVGNNSKFTILESANISFDTDYRVHNNSKIELEIKVTTPPSIDSREHLLDAMVNVCVLESAYTTVRDDVENYTFFWGGNQIQRQDGSYIAKLIPVNTKIKLIIDKGRVKVGDTLYFDGYTTNTFISKDSLIYNSVNTKNNILFYSLKLYDNDLLVKHYVPVLNNETQKYGAYDLICQHYVNTYEA